MSQDKTNAVLKELKVFEAASGMYSKQKLPPVAGIMGWMSSVGPRPGPFVTHLWRATHAIPKSEAAREHRPKTLNFKRRVEHAVGWLWDLLGIASRFKTQCVRIQSYIVVQ